jgi:hypothetical protein
MILVMRRIRHLTDAYAFPGFRPLRTPEDRRGDPFALVVVLKRRGKKLVAGPVARSFGPTMTSTDE